MYSEYISLLNIMNPGYVSQAPFKGGSTRQNAVEGGLMPKALTGWRERGTIQTLKSCQQVSALFLCNAHSFLIYWKYEMWLTIKLKKHMCANIKKNFCMNNFSWQNFHIFQLFIYIFFFYSVLVIWALSDIITITFFFDSHNNKTWV